MTAIEQFYQFMYDHRDEAAANSASAPGPLCDPSTACCSPRGQARLANVKAHDMVLEESVMQQIAEGSGLLAQPVKEGGSATCKPSTS